MTFFADQLAVERLETIQSVSLKSALHVPMNCNVSEVLYLTNVWTVKNCLAYEAISTLKKINKLHKD